METYQRSNINNEQNENIISFNHKHNNQMNQVQKKEHENEQGKNNYSYFFGLTVINNIKIHHSKAGSYKEIYEKLGNDLLEVIKNCKTDQEKEILQQTLFVLTGKNVNDLINSTKERIVVRNILDINKNKK